MVQSITKEMIPPLNSSHTHAQTQLSGCGYD